MKAYITVGCSGSGKSTLASKLIDVISCGRDLFRSEILAHKGFDVINNNIWKFWDWK